MYFNWCNIGFRKFLFMAALVVTIAPAFSQRKELDSLQKMLPSASDSLRMVVFNELSWIYKNSSIDSAVLYARKALTLAKQKDNQKFIAKAFNSLGNVKQA